MFVVPLENDVIEISGGIQYPVLSFSAYKKVPSVYVHNVPNILVVSFEDILKINNTTVSYGDNILVTNTKINRQIHLPQKYDKITLDDNRIIKVSNIKILERNNVSSGMKIIGEDLETGLNTSVRLINIVDIQRATGRGNFDSSKFKTIYKDYLGVL